MAEIKQKLQTPSVPNFIFVDALPGKREAGFQEVQKIAIGDLPDDVLEQIAEEWKIALLRRAREHRTREL